MAIVKPEIGQEEWGETLNNALDQLDEQSTRAAEDAESAVNAIVGLDSRVEMLENANANDWGKTVTLPNSSTQYRRIDIPDDGSDTSTWPDRIAFFFNGTRTGAFNEYGEGRFRPAKQGNVSLRAMAHVNGSTGDIFQVGPYNQPSTPFFRVSQTIAEATVPLSTTQYIQVAGTRVYVGGAEPTDAPEGSIWIREAT